MPKKSTTKSQNGANLGFEATLWSAADKLRGHIDSAEYKHIVLGLIFLKYISDAFEEKYSALASDKSKGADPEDSDEYQAENIFWVPKNARWSFLQANAKQPTIGKLLDEAMLAIEKDNDSLKAVLPHDYANQKLNKERLGELIDLISTIALGDKENRSKDILGRVYEYFLSQFASAEGKKGGEFFTPRCVVRVLVEMLAPSVKSRVFDPCCGSGGMFVQSEEFVATHGGRIGDIAVYGQELNNTTWKLAKMNMAIRGIDADIRWNDQGSFHHDAFPDLKADYVIANPPFNDNEWSSDGLKNDVRWKYGVPPTGNANFAWVQHFVHHLAPTGTAGFVLANGSMASNQSGEGEIRKNILEADLVDCMVALPGQLFYSTPIPVCLWFLARDKKNHKHRDRRGSVLFIDARKLGHMVDRAHSELADEDIKKIADKYHAWRGDAGAEKYNDVQGFCRSTKMDEIRKYGYMLTPERYVGTEEIEDDGELFGDKMSRLITILTQQLKKSNEIADGIKENLERLGSVRDIQEFIKQSTQKQNAEWRTVKLGDVADVCWGDTNVTKASYVASGFPAYSASGSDGFLPYADFDRTGIVLSAIGAECGKTWLAKGKWSCIKNTLRFWSTDPNVETEYLYWVTRNPVIWPKRGSAQPFISQGDARAMEIRIPSLAEQRAVLSILGSINDKIELDRQMNQTLEQTAQALFQSWVATDSGIES